MNKLKGLIYYGLVWDNYRGHGFIKAISKEEYERYKDAMDSPYWGVFDNYIDAGCALDRRYMN